MQTARGCNDPRPQLATYYVILGLLISTAGCALPRGATLFVIHEQSLIEMRPDGARERPLPPELHDAVDADVDAAGRLVIVSADQVAFVVSDLERLEPQRIEERVLAAGWSTKGDQFALLRAPQGLHYREVLLDVRDDSGHRRWEMPVGLTRATSEAGSGDGPRWRLRVSWSKDDRWIAVSTFAARGRAPRETVLVDVEQRRQHYLVQLNNTRFLGDRQVVAASSLFSSSLAGRTELVSLSVRDGHVLPVTDKTVASDSIITASDPRSGRFVLWTPVPSVLPEVYKGVGRLRIMDAAGREMGTSRTVPRNVLVCLVPESE
jgi:hypothetical protein